MNIFKGMMIALVMLLLMAILPLPIWKEFRLTENFRADFPVSDHASLKIEAGDGEIMILGVEGLTEVQVQAELVTWGNSEEGAAKNLALSKFTMEEVDGVIRLVHIPHKTGTVLRLRGSEGFGLEVGREDYVYIQIQVPLAADIEIRNGDGNIKIENVSGLLNLSTDDGDVTLQDLNGSVEFISDDGSLDMAAFAGSIKLETEEGNINFSGELIGDEHSILTEDGDIDLYLPASSALELDLRIEDGDIDSDFPLTLAGSRHHYTASINEPEARLTIEVLDNGDVRIRETE